MKSVELVIAGRDNYVINRYAADHLTIPAINEDFPYSLLGQRSKLSFESIVLEKSYIYIFFFFFFSI